MGEQMSSSPAQANLSNCAEPPKSGGSAAWYESALDMLSSQPTWPDDKERVLLEPYTYIESKPGKEIRSQLIDAFNVWLKVPEEKLTIIRRVVGMLHNSSLLMDDVEDNSDLRRGIPVAHKVYGIPQTINTANYVYFLVFSQISAMNGQGTTEMIVDEMINLHRGQGMDLFWRDSLTCPTEAEYVEMVNNKTGGLLRIAVKLMVAESSGYSGPDLVPLVNLIGLLFQIRDDYMNLQSADYADNKGFCEDLTEGKFSFPIIHSIRSSSTAASMPSPASASKKAADSLSRYADRQILSILRQRPTDIATKKYAVEHMKERTGSFAYTQDVMVRLDRLVRAETARIEELIDCKNAKLGLILDALRRGW